MKLGDAHGVIVIVVVSEPSSNTEQGFLMVLALNNQRKLLNKETKLRLLANTAFFNSLIKSINTS